MAYLHSELTHDIIEAAIEVHRALGPGLLESAYHCCLRHELSARGMSVEAEVPIPIIYKGVHLDAGYRIDLLIEKSVIVEIKSIEQLLPIHEAQLLTYLKLTEVRVGLLMNFNVPLLKDGIKRRIV